MKPNASKDGLILENSIETETAGAVIREYGHDFLGNSIINVKKTPTELHPLVSDLVLKSLRQTVEDRGLYAGSAKTMLKDFDNAMLPILPRNHSKFSL